MDSLAYFEMAQGFSSFNNIGYMAREFGEEFKGVGQTFHLSIVMDVTHIKSLVLWPSLFPTSMLFTVISESLR